MPHDIADVLLDAWAQWRARRAIGGAGFPVAAAFTRLAPGARSGSVALGDAQAAALDDAIASLRTEDASAWLVLHCHYLGDPDVPARDRRPMPMRATAHRADCALSTAYLHLRRGKRVVRERVLAIRKNR